LVQSLFPNHEWRVWKFVRAHVELGERERMEFVKDLGGELTIRHLDDWYRVTRREMEGRGSLSVLKKYPLEQLLQRAFPDHVWDAAKLQLTHGISKSQPRLQRKASELSNMGGVLGKRLVSWSKPARCRADARRSLG
jgi:hypothetical protein